MSAASSLVRALTIAAVAAAAPSCAYNSLQVPVKPPPGLLYTNFKAPLNTDVRGVELGPKRGMARTHYIREPYFTRAELFSWGEASVQAAAESAGIERIRHIDYAFTSVIEIYAQFQVIVYGE